MMMFMSFFSLNNYYLFLNTAKLFQQMSAHSDISFIKLALDHNLLEAILPALRDKSLKPL